LDHEKEKKQGVRVANLIQARDNLSMVSTQVCTASELGERDVGFEFARGLSPKVYGLHDGAAGALSVSHRRTYLAKKTTKKKKKSNTHISTLVANTLHAHRVMQHFQAEKEPDVADRIINCMSFFFPSFLFSLSRKDKET
jgi:hypothetical protein